MSIIKHVTLQKIVAHDFRYDPRITRNITYVVQQDTQLLLWLNIYSKVVYLSWTTYVILQDDTRFLQYQIYF